MLPSKSTVSLHGRQKQEAACQARRGPAAGRPPPLPGSERKLGKGGGLQSHILIDPALKSKLHRKCQVVSALSPAQGVPDSLMEDTMAFSRSASAQSALPIRLHPAPRLPGPKTCASHLLQRFVKALTLLPPPERFPWLLWQLPNFYV